MQKNSLQQAMIYVIMWKKRKNIKTNRRGRYHEWEAKAEVGETKTKTGRERKKQRPWNKGLQLRGKAHIYLHLGHRLGRPHTRPLEIAGKLRDKIIGQSNFL